jgi:WD40 repeat protein
VLAIAFSPDGETIASAGGDQSIKLWDLDSGKVLHTLAGHSGWIWSIAISPDGETLVSGGDDNTSESGELPVKSVV